MKSRIIRIEDVAFDARKSMYGARVTLAAASGPVEKALKVAGHRTWAAGQIISALKQSAQTV
ncbi:MAG: hypothetical protein AAGA15_07075 [Pseudomonadota bacterium]